MQHPLPPFRNILFVFLDSMDGAPQTGTAELLRRAAAPGTGFSVVVFTLWPIGDGAPMYWIDGWMGVQVQPIQQRAN